MAGRTLAIVGLGLIGGSLAASLRRSDDGWRLKAADRRTRAVDYALRRGLIDEGCASTVEAARGADLVVLAAPVGAIRRLLDELAPSLVPGQIVTDVGSAKATIVAHAEAVVPQGASFVGGHPVAGTERSGVESAVDGLFEGRQCVLTPTAQTPRPALEAVTALWRSVGSEVTYLAPEAHDRLFARLSHLPNLAAFGLVNAVTSALAPEDVSFGGGSWRDVTRVAQSPPVLWRDVCLENRDAVLTALDEFSAEMGRIREAVAGGQAVVLEALFRKAAEGRREPWK